MLSDQMHAHCRVDCSEWIMMNHSLTHSLTHEGRYRAALAAEKWSPSGYQVVTKWSPAGHKVVIRWSLGGH